MNDLLIFILIYGGFTTSLFTFLLWAKGPKEVSEAIQRSFMKIPFKFVIAVSVLVIAYLVGVADGRRRPAPRNPDSFAITGEGNRITTELTSLRVTGGELSSNPGGTDADLSKSFQFQEQFANGVLAVFWVIKSEQDGLK